MGSMSATDLVPGAVPTAVATAVVATTTKASTTEERALTILPAVEKSVSKKKSSSTIVADKIETCKNGLHLAFELIIGNAEKSYQLNYHLLEYFVAQGERPPGCAPWSKVVDCGIHDTP